jgi:hypothetical protein
MQAGTQASKQQLAIIIKQEMQHCSHVQADSHPAVSATRHAFIDIYIDDAACMPPVFRMIDALIY